eukprot:gene12144-14209_t
MSVNITRTPWIENYYVGDGLETLFGTKMASAFSKCPTPTEVRNIKQLTVSQQTITNQDDYTRAVSSSVTASASILSWGLSGETKNSFNYAREINSNTTHFVINNYYVKDETVFSREQLDALVFSDAALDLLKNKKFGEFKTQYGDSYIVGYATGGNYNGDICIESYKDKNTTDMQAQLSASFSNVAFKADGAVDFTNKLSTFASNYKTTVTIQGTGIALKTVNIGDINKMCEDAGNLEKLGDSRLYAIVASYDDLPQFKSVVPAKPKVDLQPNVRPEFVKKMNELYFDVQYAINSKKYYTDYFNKMIKDSVGNITAISQLTVIMSQISTAKTKFEALTLKNVQNISNNPKTNKKWQAIISVKPIIDSLETLPASVGIHKIGTDKQRETLLAKTKLLDSYNAAGWDKSPSQYIKTITTDLLVDSNPVIAFYCEYFTRINDHMSEPVPKGSFPQLWETNDVKVSVPTSSMMQSLDEIYISDAEKAAVKIHIDELQKENDVESLTVPWSVGQSIWLYTWIRRCVPSASCIYFVNLCWLLNTINDSKRFFWKSPDPLITKFCAAAKFIYKLE